MNALKKRPVAIGLTVLICLLALVFGVHKSVSREARKVETMFTEGVDGSGYGIQGDLDDRAESAGVLCKLAAKYDGAAEETAAVQEALTALDIADGPTAKAAANQMLTDSVTALSLALDELPLSEQDAKYHKDYRAAFDSSGMTLSREAADYNAAVRNYEDGVCGGLPVRLLGWLALLPDVEDFA